MYKWECGKNPDKPGQMKTSFGKHNVLRGVCINIVIFSLSANINSIFIVKIVILSTILKVFS